MRLCSGIFVGGFDPRNLLTVTSNPGLAETVQNAQLTVLAAVSLAGVALLVHRRRAAGQAPRRLVALQAALRIRAEHPAVGVLVLSQYLEVGLAMKLLADSAEGVGYLLKDRISDVKDFLGAVTRVGTGGSALDPTIVTTLLRGCRSDDPLAQLTRREREVLELMATGSSNQGIADTLVITVRAVEKYVSTIFDKLGLPATGSESRRVLAVLLYLRS